MLNSKVFNAQFSLFTTVLNALQSEFFKKNKRYWQGVKLDLSNQNRTVRATDETSSWSDKTLPGSKGKIAVDKYQTPTGHGYCLSMQVTDSDGKTYLRKYGYGPDATLHTADWTDISSLTLPR